MHLQALRLAVEVEVDVVQPVERQVGRARVDGVELLVRHQVALDAGPWGVETRWRTMSSYASFTGFSRPFWLTRLTR